MRPPVRLAVGLIALAAVAACAPPGSEIDRPSPEVSDSARPQAGASRDAPDTADPLAWIADGDLSDRGGILRRTLAWSESRGVCATDYGVAEIDRRLARGRPDDLAAADALLSGGLARYAEEVGGGDARDRAALVAAALKAQDFPQFLADIAPKETAYRRLRDALDAYAAIAESGGWQPLPPGPALKRGVTHAQIRSLRRRLGLTADLRSGDLKSPVFDGALEGAVRRFQSRNGLAVDGIVGQETRAALNVPAAARAATIAQNLCQYPDLAAKQVGTAIIVNVLAAELRFYRDGELRFSSRVIVGREDWPTPVLSDTISAVEINPYWNIPPRIARNEVIPRIIKDPGYLGSRNIRVLSLADESPREIDPATIDWASVDKGSPPFRLRQDPGPQNPMGSVKFRLSNPYSIFLHDTPAQQLFERAKRSLSHGCVRVDGAQRLAKLVLEAASDTSPLTFEQAIADGAPVTIRLRQPVPVHLVAVSAWVDADGTVHFRSDPTGDLAEKSCIASLNTVAGNMTAGPECGNCGEARSS